MSAALDVDTSTIELLDFVPELPCEAKAHGTGHTDCREGARWVQRSVCPACGQRDTLLVCERKRQFMRSLSDIKDTGLTGCRAHSPADLWSLTYDPIPEVR